MPVTVGDPAEEKPREEDCRDDEQPSGDDAHPRQGLVKPAPVASWGDSYPYVNLVTPPPVPEWTYRASSAFRGMSNAGYAIGSLLHDSGNDQNYKAGNCAKFAAEAGGHGNSADH